MEAVRGSQASLPGPHPFVLFCLTPSFSSSLCSQVGHLPSFILFCWALQYFGKQSFLIHRKKKPTPFSTSFSCKKLTFLVHIWGNNKNLTYILASLVFPPSPLSSQKHSKGWGWQAPLVTICSNPLLTAGSAGAGCSGPATSHRSERLQAWTFHSLPGQPVSAPGHLLPHG